MKKLLIILVLLTFNCFSQEKGDGFIYWKNNQNGVLNYMLIPELKVVLNKLDTGLNDYYAMLTFKTEFKENVFSLVKEKAKGLNLSRVSVSQYDEEVKIELVDNNLTYTVPILHTPSGIEILETFYINKSAYEMILVSRNFTTNFSQYATPFVSKVVERIKYDLSVCDDLFIDGTNILDVANNYSKLIDTFSVKTLKYSNTLESLKKSIEKSCIKKPFPKSTSLLEFIKLDLEQNTTGAPIEGITQKGVYDKSLVEISMESRGFE